MENTIYLTAYQQRVLRAVGDAIKEHKSDGSAHRIDISRMLGSDRLLSQYAVKTLQTLINLRLVISIHPVFDRSKEKISKRCASEYTLSKNGWHIYRQL